MWRIAGRTAGVFLFWAVMMLVGIEAGLQSSTAELLACFGAGGTIFFWGSLIRRQERQIDDATAHALSDEPSRERATP